MYKVHYHDSLPALVHEGSGNHSYSFNLWFNGIDYPKKSSAIRMETLAESSPIEEEKTNLPDSAVSEDSQNGSENRDFVSNFVDRLCENCKRMREQIIMRGKCTSEFQEDDHQVTSDHNKENVLPTDSEAGLMANLHRRSVSF